MNQYSKEKDVLAVGLTRTPTVMGINYKLFFANVIIGVLVCIYSKTFWGAPLFLIVHVVFARLSIKEPNFLYLHYHAFQCTPPVFNRWYWGNTNSYEAW